MAVRKDQKSGKWLMDVWVGVHRIRRLLPDRKTAELLEKDLKVKEARGELLDIRPIKNITFEAFSKDYLEYVRTNLSEGRYQGVESVVRATLVPYFGPKNLKEIDARMIETFKAAQAKPKEGKEKARTLKASSINAYLKILKTMFKLMVQWKNLKASPFREIKALKVDDVEPPHLSIGDANRLLEACRGDRNLYAFAAIGLNTGMRVGEMVNLTWADVDLRRGVVKVRGKTEAEGLRAWRVKTGDLRDIPVNDFLAEVLAKHPRHITSPYVLYHEDGAPYTEGVIWWMLRKAGKDAKLTLRTYPHLLRHTFGTHLAAAGVDLVAIQRLMGHRDIKMTMRYLHAAPDRMKGAVENLAFGRPIAQNLDSQGNEQNQQGG
ncbi:MAG: site-specific integrase [Candidatus Latescibacteria bacterium]|nr:site-specific integrase [Candidatus Latescibacterota bacterium]